MPDEFPAVRFRMRRDRLLEPWKERLPDEHSTSSSVPILIYKLPQGGEFRIIKGFLNEEGQSSLERELLEDHRRLFRQYFVQGQKEPRIHFLLHENGHDPNASSATEVESKRIGYRYGRVIMLAKPLKNLPFLAKLSNDLAAICQLTSWNIGVNPVLYRDTNDCINLHSDNDQGETTILTLIVSVPDNSSSTRRPVLIRSRPNIKAGSNNRSKRSTDTEEEQYEITLNPGDAYVMDESMQKNYVHGVGRAAPPPPGKSSRELVVVFRNGRQENFAKDSGISVPDLTPPKQSSYHFGEMEDLVLGETYPRTLLCAFKFHRSSQAGVSGNAKEGACSIIVSGHYDTGEEANVSKEKLHYIAKLEKGGQALITSYNLNLPIRVFRSSKLKGPLKANPYVSGNRTYTGYRYDGLYKVANHVSFGPPEGKSVKFLLVSQSS